MRPQKLLEACRRAPYISGSIIFHRGASSAGTGWDSIGAKGLGHYMETQFKNEMIQNMIRI